MQIRDLGLMDYRDAWQTQEAAHERVVAGGEEQVYFVEHRPVITLGRRAGVAEHLLASHAVLKELGVQVVQSDRGGDITFHGLGQLVAYPIIQLNRHALSVGGYVRALQDAAIATLKEFGIPARCESGAVGVWIENGATGKGAKICAIGVRIRRGVSLHGLALNVTTDLRYFNLIVPCGLHGRGVTSMQQVLGNQTPDLATVKPVLARKLEEFLFSPNPVIQRPESAECGVGRREGAVMDFQTG